MERGSFASDWGGGFGENYEEDQNQDREHQRASAQEDDFAHHIGLQQVVASHKSLPEIGGGGGHESPLRARTEHGHF